jgi:hypothetical protein
MITTIHSKLLDRDIFIISESDEGKALLKEGKPRSNIYYQHEIWQMVEYPPEAVLATQRVKDVFGKVVVIETRQTAPISLTGKREAANHRKGWVR